MVWKVHAEEIGNAGVLDEAVIVELTGKQATLNDERLGNRECLPVMSHVCKPVRTAPIAGENPSSSFCKKLTL